MVDMSSKKFEARGIQRILSYKLSSMLLIEESVVSIIMAKPFARAGDMKKSKVKANEIRGLVKSC